VISQGEIYWIELDEPVGSEPGYRHPHVIVQNNLFNLSKINTVLACPFTTNLKLASAPGNVLIDRKYSKLPKNSVVNVSQVFVVNKSELVYYVATLPVKLIAEIINGIKLVLEPREPE